MPGTFSQLIQPISVVGSVSTNATSGPTTLGSFSFVSGSGTFQVAGTMTVFQGSMPWFSVGTTSIVQSGPLVVSGSGTFVIASTTVLQGGPFVVSGSATFTIGTNSVLQGGPFQVSSSGTFVVGTNTVLQGGPFAVSGSAVFTVGTNTVLQGAAPWVVSGSGTFVVASSTVFPGTVFSVVGSISLRPSTTGGLTTFHLVSAATTNATTIKTSAGQLYGWFIYNNSTAVSKLAFHNVSTASAAGASIFFSIPIPASSGANVEFSNGIPFSTGISFTTVTGLADNNTTAVAANDLTINLWYL